MPSPFPGMDPWVEGPELFPDFHHSFCTALREALNNVLPQGYFAKTNTLVWIDEDRKREPEVSLLTPRDRNFGGGTAVLPLRGMETFGLLDEPIEQLEVEIYTTGDKRLVTAFELLSPSNKSEGAGRRAYRDKQRELRSAGVHLVEFDFLRAGLHTTLVPRSRLAESARHKHEDFTYHVCVLDCRNGGERMFARILSLKDRLPEIGIPLDDDREPIVVDLQPIADRCYDGGRYADQINYAEPCDPPLTPDQQVWADGILAARGGSH